MIWILSLLAVTLISPVQIGCSGFTCITTEQANTLHRQIRQKREILSEWFRVIPGRESLPANQKYEWIGPTWDTIWKQRTMMPSECRIDIVAQIEHNDAVLTCVFPEGPRAVFGSVCIN